MNGILLIDKPAGWTSMDVCAKLRGAFRERRVGHSGTLDPMATGLLVVFLGRATRAVEFAEADEKSYVAGLRLGIVTDTQDTTGTVLETHEVNITEESMQTALSGFRGELEQLPPMYSAIKIKGKPLYKAARRGENVERSPRKITIHELYCTRTGEVDITLFVRCSKGTYIRTLCHDLGAALGGGGAMSSLRRTRSGAFDLRDAHTLEAVVSAAEQGRAEELLLPVDTLFRTVKRLELTPGQERAVRNGMAFTSAMPEGRYRVYGGRGEFLALCEVSQGTMRTIKSFFEV